MLIPTLRTARTFNLIGGGESPHSEMTLPATFRNQVVCGDVMDTLRALPDKSVDMIFGDPDYGVGINYAGRKYTQKWDEYIA